MIHLNELLLLFFCIGFIVASELGIYVKITLNSNWTLNRIFVLEGQVVTINTTLTFALIKPSWLNKTFIYRCWMENVMVAILKNWRDLPLQSINFENTTIFVKTTMVAKRLGGSYLYCSIRVKGLTNTFHSIHQERVAHLIVRRVASILEIIYRIFIVCFVVLITFVMGCGLDKKIIFDYLKKPLSPAIGFICQFGFMPLISFCLAKFTNLESAFAFGLLTIGCSPGGGPSNVWTMLFGGDIDLSMTMTFISSCSALFMMPFWLFVLGRFFIDPSMLKIPYRNIGLNLLLVVIPIGLGMLLRFKFESKAIILATKVKILGVLFILFILTFGSYANLYIFKLIAEYPYLLPIGAGLPWIGFLFGAIASAVTGRTVEQSIAIAIETGIQNIGISILILKFSMPQPNGDLGAVMPIIVAVFTPMPLYFILFGLTIKRKYYDKKEETGDLEISSVNKEPNEVFLNDKILLPG